VSLRRRAGRVGTAALVVVVLALVVGQLLGTPILLGYVTSDSMEPTIDEGDGFVAIPHPLAGDPQEGDVIVYEARELEGGGLTTHRVVEVREDGYVTAGDNNPFTDQDADEPVVTDEQVRAEALQVNDYVLTVPHLGTVVSGIGSAAAAIRSAITSTLGIGGSATSPGGFGFLLIVVGLALVGLAAGGGARGVRRTSRSRDREEILRVWAAIGAVATLVVLLATAAMVLPAGVQEFGIASDSQPADDPLSIEPGGSSQVDYPVSNAGVIPTVVVLEPRSDGVSVEDDRMTVDGRSTRSVETTLEAPEEEGLYFRHLAEHRYLLVLPPGVIGALHDLHPLLALLAVDLVIGGFVVLVGVAFLGTDDLRIRRRGADVPLTVRLRRRVVRWFS